MTEPIHSSSKFKLVVASDTIPLSYNGVVMACRGISFATAGDIGLVNDVGTTILIPNGALAAGVIHPICASYIRATGLGAAGIVAYF